MAGKTEKAAGRSGAALVEKKPRRGKTVGIMSCASGLGRKTVCLNIATSLAQRNFRVLYGFSPKDRLAIRCRSAGKPAQAESKYFRIADTEVQGLKVLRFLDEADQMSLQKMEEMAVRLPENIRAKFDYFIYNIQDPYGFPDRYFLLNMDMFVMVVRSDASAFSNVFLQLEKLSFIPKPPREIGLVFNKTKDMTLAFEAYRNILEEAKKLGVRSCFTFLGSVPFDGFRQEFADKGRQPLSFYFPDSPFASSVSLVASKIINY